MQEHLNFLSANPFKHESVTIKGRSRGLGDLLEYQSTGSIISVHAIRAGRFCTVHKTSFSPTEERSDMLLEGHSKPAPIASVAVTAGSRD